MTTARSWDCHFKDDRGTERFLQCPWELLPPSQDISFSFCPHVEANNLKGKMPPLPRARGLLPPSSQSSGPPATVAGCGPRGLVSLSSPPARLPHLSLQAFDS